MIKKRIFTIALSSLLLGMALSCRPVFAQDNNTISERLSGNDRYETSVAISKEGWGQANTVIIASGLNYPDALSAASLSKLKDAPILLSEKDALEPVTIAEIKRLKATKAFIIGGTGSIGAGVEEQLKGLGIGITRIGGIDRFDTSEKVAELVGPNNGVVVASAWNFPDALSIAPIAGMKGMPILLSSRDSLSPNMETYLKGKKIPVSYITGGTGVLSTSIDSTIPNSKRLSGADRYATNLSINNQFAGDLNFNKVYFASANDFPDALCGAALAAKNNSPIFLINKDSIPDATIDFIKSKNVQHAVILGGSGSVEKTVENTITNIISSLIVHPTSVSLNKTSDNLTVGGTDTLVATVAPNNTTNKAVTWTSSNNSVASVDNSGNVTAVSPGAATITVSTVDGGFSATCNITVTNPVVNVTSVSLNKNTDILTVGSTDTLSASIAPTNATNKALTWTSTNNSVATVDNSGNVTAVSAGSAIITVTSADGSFSATCNVTVTNPTVKVTSVSLNKTSDTLSVGGSDTLTASIFPTNAANQAVTWTSTNNSVVTVDSSGNVTAVGAGNALIIVTTSDGSLNATCNITVTNPPPSIKLTKTSDTLIVSQTDTIAANVVNVSNKTVTWTSSNNSVATVDNSGNVTAMSAGNAVITATTSDGSLNASCNVTVYNQGQGHMLISSSLVNFTASYEGYSATPYVGADVQNHTIGYGHVILPGENYTNLTQPEAWALLKQDLQNTATGVNNFTSDLTLSQQQFDALVDFAYNCGVSGVQNSTLMKDIRAGAPADKLETDFQMWSYCNGTPLTGLYRRRTDEWQIYTSGNYVRDYPTAPDGYM